MTQTIDHIGIISDIRNEVAYVSFVQASGCASCASKSACGVADSEHRHIEIPVKAGGYCVGDEVIVKVKVTTGFAALWWAYLLPFIVMMVTMVTVNSLGFSEGMSGLFAIGILVPYYTCVFVFRKMLFKTMHLNVFKR
jgi:sigma-E factor negative regulatory protein RseC